MKSSKEFLKFFFVIFILLGSFLTWSWWDERGVRGFCGDVKPGTLVVALSAIAETHHQNTGSLRTSIFDKEKGTWFTFLPVMSTFGEVGCDIEHDKTVVLSSRMQ
jgi:hypothetical protein